jgi:hypothetical protein
LVTEFVSAISGFYGAFRDFSGVNTTSYMADVVGTCSWRVADAMGTFRWWILAASTVDSTLTVGLEHLDAIDALGISNWRFTDAVGTSSSWRAVGTSSSWRVNVAVGVMGPHQGPPPSLAQV